MRGLKAIIKSFIIVRLILILIGVIQYLMSHPDNGHFILTLMQVGALFGLATMGYAALMQLALDYIGDEDGKSDSN